jgi:hypothetical protein
LNRRRYASPASTRKGACKSRHLHRRQRTCDHSVTWRPRHLAPGDDPTSTATTRSELYSPQCTTAPRSGRRLPQGSGQRDTGHRARHRARHSAHEDSPSEIVYRAWGCSSRLPLTGHPSPDTPVSTPQARLQRRRWAGAIGMGGHGPGGWSCIDHDPNSVHRARIRARALAS